MNAIDDNLCIINGIFMVFRLPAKGTSANTMPLIAKQKSLRRRYRVSKLHPLPLPSSIRKVAYSRDQLVATRRSDQAVKPARQIDALRGHPSFIVARGPARRAVISQAFRLAFLFNGSCVCARHPAVPADRDRSSGPSPDTRHGLDGENRWPRYCCSAGIPAAVGQ